MPVYVADQVLADEPFPLFAAGETQLEHQVVGHGEGLGQKIFIGVFNLIGVFFHLGEAQVTAVLEVLLPVQVGPVFPVLPVSLRHLCALGRLNILTLIVQFQERVLLQLLFNIHAQFQRGELQYGDGLAQFRGHD